MRGFYLLSERLAGKKKAQVLRVSLRAARWPAKRLLPSNAIR